MRCSGGGQRTTPAAVSERGSQTCWRGALRPPGRCEPLTWLRNKLQLLCLFCLQALYQDDETYPASSCDTSRDLSFASHTIRQAYSTVAESSPNLDLRFILPLSTSSHPPPTLRHKVGVVMSHVTSFSTLGKLPSYKLLIQRVSHDLSLMFQPLSLLGDNEGVELSPQLAPLACYDHVALGGTFDLLHMGHRLLLTESLLLSRRRLLVGVADGHLLESKVLPELIAPVGERVEGVRDFLEDVKYDVHHQVVSQGVGTWYTANLTVCFEATLVFIVKLLKGTSVFLQLFSMSLMRLPLLAHLH